MRAEIISIGTELLLGEIVDTNAAWLAQQLAAAGVDVYFRTTVGDNVGRIAEAVRIALGRADLVITSGGLGPTVDDMTREGIAQAVGVELVLDETLLGQVRARFEKWTMRMSENNVRQAYLPRGATPVENPVGTAPVFIVEKDGHFIFTLPGVPREMKYLTETRVLPWLRERTGGQEIILSKTLRTCAVGESVIDHKIADLETSSNPTVGLAAHPGQTDVRITAKAQTRVEAEKLIREMEVQVRERLGDAIYGEGNETVQEVVARLLAANNARVALVESNTQGQIAEQLRVTPEGSRILAASTVLDRVETVDEASATALAQAALAQSGAALALAILSTLDANVDMYGQTTGQTAMAVASARGITARTYTIGGAGNLAQNWTAIRALDLIRKALIARL
ncbi:MAG: CinA family nicotinamide mononucleotide deamidase-related protein [Anaerolineae bacterium]